MVYHWSPEAGIGKADVFVRGEGEFPSPMRKKRQAEPETAGVSKLRLPEGGQGKVLMNGFDPPE